MGIKDFRRRLVHTITREKFLGVDDSGDPIYDEANPQTYKARIEGRSRLVRSADGSEVQSTRRVFVDTGQGDEAVIFDVRDRITLPTQFWPADRAQPAILDVVVRVGREGVDHLEVLL